MILQALASYYERLASDKNSGIAPEGLQKKAIPYVIVLDREGRFRGLEDTREPAGKKMIAREFTVPHEKKRSGKNAWMKANLLWDNEGYVLGFSKTAPEKAEKQHKSFIDQIQEIFPDPSVDEGVAAVLRFIERGDFSGIVTHPLWEEIEKQGGNMSFRLEGENRLVCQRDAVLRAIRRLGEESGPDELQTCLVTGVPDTPARLHTAIKGVWGAQSSGANIVSFNLTAFNSYGKTQGLNSPVGKKAEHAYTTVLNRLLATGSRQRLQVGDSSTVFWAERPHRMEDWFHDFFGNPAGGEDEDGSEAIHALYASAKSGAEPLDEDLTTKFYVLGLAPNASRISVRFWYEGTVGEVAANIRRHFDDCRIVHGPNEPEPLSLFRLLISTALQGDSKNIQPNLAGALMKSILSGTPYPSTLLSSALRRVRAEREISYPRAAIIKAVLVREARYYNRIEKEVGMSLDTSNTNEGYLLGRLFAVLERVQERANPGLNATIRDRFYASASCTPIIAFSHLMKLKNHHIAKLENRGEAVNLEKLIGSIMDGLSDFPSHLDIRDQGRFAVGYYHQRQDFFRKKDHKDD